MRTGLIALGLLTVACTPKSADTGRSRTEVVRDVEGYAIASCLVHQTEPYLKDQGDAWAAVIIQRMKGDLDPLAQIAAQVKAEVAKGEMTVIRDESQADKDKALPVQYCGEIIDKPDVRIAILKVAAALAPAYGRQQ